MTTPRVALVTGATQGLGLALVGELARRLGPDDIVYLTGRNREKAAALAAGLSGGSGAAVVPEVFDVAEQDSALRVASVLEDRHDGVDFVFNNAVMRVEPTDNIRTVVREYVEVNNLATSRVLRAFAPLVRDGGRLIVVGSSLGTLDYLAPALHPLFRNLESLDDVDHVITAWRDDVENGSDVGTPWPGFINIPSKIAQTAALRVLAQQRRASDTKRGVLLAAVCPGMMNTPTSSAFWDVSDAPTPEQAAVPLADLALGTVDHFLYGELSRGGTVLPFDQYGTYATA